MSTGLLDIMKRTSMDAISNAQMCDLRYGTVVSKDPLKIRVTNVLTLPESLLVVPQHLTAHKMKITLNVDTSYASGEEGTFNHNHNIKKKTEITIHNALEVGDKVAMIRKQGGQSYYILDRV